MNRSGKILSAANSAKLQQATAHLMTARRHLDGAAASMRSAHRAAQEVLDAAGLDEDSQAVQTSDGTDDTGGATEGRDLSYDERQRRLAVFNLSEPF